MLFKSLRHRIHMLEMKVDFLEQDRDRKNQALVRLESDLYRLANHFGVEFVDVNERRVVETKSPHRSEG